MSNRQKGTEQAKANSLRYLQACSALGFSPFLEAPTWVGPVAASIARARDPYRWPAA